MFKATIPPAALLALALGFVGPPTQAASPADGQALWEHVEGPAGYSCASCHTPIEATMRGRAATFPKYIASLGREVTLEERINQCRQKALGAEPWAPDAPELQAVAALLKSLN